GQRRAVAAEAGLLDGHRTDRRWVFRRREGRRLGLGHHPAGFDTEMARRPIGEAAGIVVDEDDDAAGGDAPRHLPVEDGPPDGIEARPRLVEHEELRITDEGGGDGHLLRRPLRQGPQRPGPVGADPEPFQPGGRLLPGIPPAPPVDAAHVHEERFGGKGKGGAEALGHEARPGPVPHDSPARFGGAGDEPEQRRLAAAVHTEDAHERAWGQSHVGVAHDPRPAQPVALAHPPQFHRRRTLATPVASRPSRAKVCRFPPGYGRSAACAVRRVPPPAGWPSGRWSSASASRWRYPPPLRPRFPIPGRPSSARATPTTPTAWPWIPRGTST